MKYGLQRFTKVIELPISIIVTIVIVAWKKLCLITRLLIALIIMVRVVVVTIVIVVVITSLEIFDISNTIKCNTLILGPEFGFVIVV